MSASMETTYAKRTYALGPSFIPIAAPIAANFCAIRNRGDNAITMRTIVDDPNTEDVLAPGVSESTLSQPPVGSVRFALEKTLFYAMSADGSILTVTWVY